MWYSLHNHNLSSSRLCGLCGGSAPRHSNHVWHVRKFLTFNLIQKSNMTTNQQISHPLTPFFHAQVWAFRQGRHCSSQPRRCMQVSVKSLPNFSWSDNLFLVEILKWNVDNYWTLNEFSCANISQKLKKKQIKKCFYPPDHQGGCCEISVRKRISISL